MRIENIKKFVKIHLGNESSGHDYLHALRVYENSKLLTKNLNVNFNVVYTSALIHDLIDHKLKEELKIDTSDIREFLIEESYELEDVNHIIEVIENISYSKGNVPESIEGKIVQDADRLDALGAIGIARTFAYGGKNKRLLYNPDTLDGSDSLSHFHQKLYKLDELMNTQVAKDEAKLRIRYMKEFERALLREVKNINQ